MQGKWKDVTNQWTEAQRHYKSVYLEKDEVYADTVEVSLFSSEVVDYEIYVSFGKMYGIVYTNKQDSERLYKEIRSVLEEEYKKNGVDRDEFIDEFHEKYKICLPMDVLFDEEKLMQDLLKIWE